MSSPYYMSDQNNISHHSPSQYTEPAQYINQPQYNQNPVMAPNQYAQAPIYQQQPHQYNHVPQFKQQPRPNLMGYQHHVGNSAFQSDFTEIFKRVVKYLVEGLAVAFVAYYFVGRNKLDIRDIVMLGITAAFVFAILDVFSPTVSLGVRFGAGFGIGQGLFGPAMMGAPVLAPSIL